MATHANDRPISVTGDRPEAPTESLVAGTGGDRGVSGGTPLSSDQRYCVVCGERRGAARFDLSPVPATAAETAAAPMPPARASRMSAGTTIVVGVFTLLLAMLIGVLIGHSAAGGVRTIASQPRPIIRVVNGGSAAAAPSTSGTASTPAPSTGGKAAGGSAHTKSSTVTPKAKKATPAQAKQSATQQQSAASHITGGTHNAAPTSTVGGSCATGSAGCNKTTHKFDGSFFGG